MLVRSNGNVTSNNVKMKAITELEEKSLDRRNTDHVYFYGDFDHNNPKHLDILREFELVNKDYSSIIHSNFDYDAGYAKCAVNYIAGEADYLVKTTATIDPVLWFKYNHCLLGKPAKVIVFNSDVRGYVGD